MNKAKFLKIPSGKIFANGLFIGNDGQLYKWLAKKGMGFHDWAIYFGYPDYHLFHLAEHGSKLIKHEAQQILQCTNDVIKLYRS